ncbi:MAG TPA: pyruvate dehydrogenase (acetyl-transferring) E1 component subunit alpha [Tepidisphaeraceae bacterium]|nr:pyruvate dehydrogenase (acetyl-transferring) E1 component subunit alpha [Tepidisphaeraceae bacterium]
MPLTTAYQGEIPYLQILDPDGNLDESLAKGTLSDADVKHLYEHMILNREYDDSAFRLQRSGRLGTFPQCKGHEAAALGAARAMRKGHDYLVPYYRENPASFYHGLPMHYILMFWGGDERGNAIPRNISMSPLTIAIGTQGLHGVGHAWAFKYRKEDRVVVAFFGDGATSTGDIHEAMNWGSVLKAPIVFSCINNAWAISVPQDKQTGAETFAQKAIAYGMPGIRVDGNDIFAVYKAHRDAIENARKGNGPTLVESVTYRIADHTTADDARRYRPAGELEAAQKLDPMIRTRKYLETRKLWNDELEKKTWEKAKATVADVIAQADKVSPPDSDDIFNHTFEELPPDLIRQRDLRHTHSIGLNPEEIGLKPQPEEAAH